MLLWQRVAQAWAKLAGRDFVIPSDLQAVAIPVLTVRLVSRVRDSSRSLTPFWPLFPYRVTMNHLSLQRLRLSGWLMLLVCLAGCGQSKESLHEMDHVTPEHWPVSLQDAAVKVRERA